MLFYTNLRAQLDEQFPSLASRARQTLTKSCYPHTDPQTAFGSTAQPYRSENALLHQQLIILNRPTKRLPLFNPDRFRLVFLAHFTRFWQRSMHIIQLDILLR